MAVGLKKGDRVKSFGREGTVVRKCYSQDYTVIVHWDDTKRCEFMKTWDLEKVGE